MSDVARKVMGDVPIAYVEGVGGKRVSEDEIVAVGKNDVSILISSFYRLFNSRVISGLVFQNRTMRQDSIWRAYLKPPRAPC